MDFYKKIANLIRRAMLYEVCTTPKPGLVDGNGNGAHSDMSIFQFVDSTLALQDTMRDCVAYGAQCVELPSYEILKGLRLIGINGEQEMLKSTGGINTQKGLVFSMGLLACCIGLVYARNLIISESNIRKCVMQICQGLVERELSSISQTKYTGKLTAGERLYVEYGIDGIRGEAERGFPTVFEKSLPYLRKQLCSHEKNTAFVNTLLLLMTVTKDTNAVNRGGLQALEFLRNKGENALELGGAATIQGLNYIKIIDKQFIQRNISPGGCADLLAITIFMHSLMYWEECEKYI